MGGYCFEKNAENNRLNVNFYYDIDLFGFL